MKSRIVGAGLIAASTLIGITAVGSAATAAPADGLTTISLSYRVDAGEGDNAKTIADALTPEVFVDGENVAPAACDPPSTDGKDTIAFSGIFCGFDPGTNIVVGVDGIPDGYSAGRVFCGNDLVDERLTTPSAEISLGSLPLDCTVVIAPTPTVYIDKVVTGGVRTASDFSIELYQDGELVANVVDPSDDTCNPGQLDAARCASVALAPGDYQLGEAFAYGYQMVHVECSTAVEEPLLERFADGVGELAHDFGGTICRIENRFFDQTIESNVEVVNDDGGTATGDDFTIEVFDDSGTIVTSGLDPLPDDNASGLLSTLPIGSYTFGVDGPDGYVATVMITGDIIASELIEDSSAEFTLNPSERLTAVIRLDDVAEEPAPTTPTTTPTTTVETPATTDAPATTMPVATLPAATAPAPTAAPTAVLPETGSTSTMLVLWALVSVTLGAGIVFATRRRTV